MNTINLLGRICGEIELKTTPNGVSVTSFKLAVDRSYTPKGEERKTDFIPCVAWRNTAEFIAKYFKKGQRMAVTGELQTRQYTASDGGQRTAFEVVVDNAFFCESKSVPNTEPNTEPSAEFKAAVMGDFEEITTDEDLPF
jgi:single-strand DNA-binding protein